MLDYVVSSPKLNNLRNVTMKSKDMLPKAFSKSTRTIKPSRLFSSDYDMSKQSILPLSLICIVLLGRNLYFLIATKSGCANHLEEIATLEVLWGTV